MKVKTILIPEDEEIRAELFVREVTPEIEEASNYLARLGETSIVGSNGRESYILSENDVVAFIVEEAKVVALTLKHGRLSVRLRLYQIEEIVSHNFVKINQSSLINVTYIERFDASVSGSLRVKLKNGYSDYVSRRNVRKIKERFGI